MNPRFVTWALLVSGALVSVVLAIAIGYMMHARTRPKPEFVNLDADSLPPVESVWRPITNPPPGYAILRKDNRFSVRTPTGYCFYRDDEESRPFLTYQEAVDRAWRQYRYKRKAESQEDQDDARGLSWERVSP